MMGKGFYTVRQPMGLPVGNILHLFIGIAFFILIVAVLVLAIMFIVKIAKGNHNFHDIHRPRPDFKPPLKPDNAFTFLNERLAKGEITEEEYERIKSRIINS